MKRHVLSYLASLLIISTTYAQNSSVVFDGTNDYIDCGTDALLAANTIRTMECWVKFNNLTASQEILSKSSNSSGIELLLIGNQLSFYCMNSPTNTSYYQYPVSNLVTGRWYHIAATWGGTKESMQIYVNGVAVTGTLTHVGNINPIGLTNPSGSFKIGQWSDAENRAFNGTIDEVRVWNTIRTATEIKNNMYNVATNAPGLIAYYKLNEGTLTTANNSTANTGLTGTLTNGPTWAASPVQFANNALEIDGADDYVTMPGNAAYNISSGTVEFWVKPTTLNPVVNACILGVRGSGGTKFSIHITPTTIGFFNGGYFTLSTTFNTGQWYHLAFVCNGTNTVCYKDGVSLGTYPTAFGTASNQTLIIGRVKDATEYEPFNGAVDELRIWNTQQTSTQINNNRNVSLTGTETGLVALYTFNQGIGSGNNAGMLTAIDLTATNNHGSLVNFALSGTASNYIGDQLYVLPVTYSYFTAGKQNGQVLLQWQTEQEENSAVFIVERSTNGIDYEAIGELKAAGTSGIQRMYSFTDAAPAGGKNYYRLKQVDLDGHKAYSVIRIVDFVAGARLTWYAAGKNTIEVRLENGRNETYKLLDLKGGVLQTGNLQSGRVRFTGLKAGAYAVQVQGSIMKTIQFVVQ